MIQMTLDGKERERKKVNISIRNTRDKSMMNLLAKVSACMLLFTVSEILC